MNFTGEFNRNSNDGELIINENNVKSIIQFSDRPFRQTTTISFNQFINLFSGTFERDPPNGVLVNNEEQRSYIITLNNFTQNEATFNLSLLPGETHNISNLNGVMNLFVDADGSQSENSIVASSNDTFAVGVMNLFVDADRSLSENSIVASSNDTFAVGDLFYIKRNYPRGIFLFKIIERNLTERTATLSKISIAPFDRTTTTHVFYIINDQLVNDEWRLWRSDLRLSSFSRNDVASSNDTFAVGNVLVTFTNFNRYVRLFRIIDINSSNRATLLHQLLVPYSSTVTTHRFNINYDRLQGVGGTSFREPG